MSHLSSIAKAVKALESAVASETQLESAARMLAYDCLRIVILGSNGLDTSSPCSARLRPETEHFCRKRVRQRLQFRIRNLKAALKDYPN